ncbi:MAG: MCE family protein, partial [Rhodobacteraceae bacterium]|nr:MCE family protein [Paracoccaceae bacterium]
MSENRFEILAGLVVLCAGIGFAIYAGHSAGLSVDQQGYSLRASFRSADGVQVGTDVRLAGVKVGRVAELHLNPQTFFADAVLE